MLVPHVDGAVERACDYQPIQGVCSQTGNTTIISLFLGYGSKVKPARHAGRARPNVEFLPL